MRIYIFECNDETQGECFERNLFGSNSKWPTQVKQGDICLLYNYSRGSEHMIYGVYKAISNGIHKIVPEAWRGRYPFQVRVALASKEMVAVKRRSIEKFIVANGRVKNVLTDSYAQDVFQFYASSYSATQEKAKEIKLVYEDYRDKFPAEYRCTDGHRVRSKSEQLIDEWLFKHHISHGYEELPNLPERLIPDFTLHFPDIQPVFIEFWGLLNNPNYNYQRFRKCEAYVRHGCRLIELYEDNIKNLDFVMREKLKVFGGNLY